MGPMTDPTHIAIALLLLALGLLVIWVVALSGRGGRRSRRRNAHAQAGEARAEAILEGAGYAVLDRQVRGYTVVIVDGEALEVEVRVDFIVARGRREFVAEVKTGDYAPDPTHPPTRRQLLEYGRAFPDHGLLLVDAEAGVVMEIAFP